MMKTVHFVQYICYHNFEINMPKNIELSFQQVSYMGCELHPNKGISKKVGVRSVWFFNDLL